MRIIICVLLGMTLAVMAQQRNPRTRPRRQEVAVPLANPVGPPAASVAIPPVASAQLPAADSAAYALPDGSEFLLSAPLNTNFRCENAGYFADIDNNCQIFHVCDAQTYPDGTQELRQYTFVCGNQTIFNQFSLTCASPEESVPCEQAPQFYRLNERIGQPQVLFHQEEDVAEFARYAPQRAPRRN
ncbi:uncharacterized protein LOC141852439 [Brevipalpus obovatus]|uniref:uncharacterized protein LOC141852439 n=1 Tax=Brevipalpus obovatus TaxID=246614 RepID=UPI003D9E47E7